MTTLVSRSKVEKIETALMNCLNCFTQNYYLLRGSWRKLQTNAHKWMRKLHFTHQHLLCRAQKDNQHIFKGRGVKVCSSDKAAQETLEKRFGTSKQVFFSRTFQDMKCVQECPACVMISCGFQNMFPSLVATRHLPRPLMKLMTLALLQHTAVPSIVGKEDKVSRVVLNQDKSLLVKSTNVHVLFVSWLCPAGHSFHGTQEPTAGVF